MLNEMRKWVEHYNKTTAITTANVVATNAIYLLDYVDKLEKNYEKLREKCIRSALKIESFAGRNNPRQREALSDFKKYLDGVKL